MKKFVYVLREDMYHEWAWENGATNLIAVSDCIDTIINYLRTYLNMELSEDDERILDYPNAIIDDIITGAINDLENNHNVYIDVYIDEENYDNGRNHGAFVIEKREVE